MWTSWHAIGNSLAQLFSPMSNVFPTHWSIAMFSLPLHRGKYSEGDFVYSRTMGPSRSFKWRLKVYPSGTSGTGTACLDSNRQCMLSQHIQAKQRCSPCGASDIESLPKTKSMEVDVDGNTITCLTYLNRVGRGLNMILHMATHGWVGSQALRRCLNVDRSIPIKQLVHHMRRDRDFKAMRNARSRNGKNLSAFVEVIPPSSDMPMWVSCLEIEGI